MALKPYLALRRLRKNLRLPGPALEEIQRARLRRLLDHAYRNVVYYRELFDAAGVAPEEIRGVEELGRIPPTSKLNLQAQPQERIIARGLDPQRLKEDVTSGSTGIPLHVYFTEEDYLIRSLTFIRTFMESGYRLWDRQALVCDTRFISSRRYWFQGLGLFRKTYIPVQLDLDEQIALLRSSRPDYIHGYARSLGEIARRMVEKDVRDVSPKMVCTGAEMVGAGTREVINRAFGVEMVDTYATIESGLIAWECVAHRGYHINIDNVVLEFVDDGGPVPPGRPGRVLVTNLHSYAMPIIRYELGDLCIPGEGRCSCGSWLPLMSVVEGRADDMVRTPGGRTVSPNSITNAMEAVVGVRQFRVVQERENRLAVLLVPGEGFSDATIDDARHILAELLREKVDIDVRRVSEIPRDKSGKIRAVISNIRHGRDRGPGGSSG